MDTSIMYLHPDLLHIYIKLNLAVVPNVSVAIGYIHVCVYRVLFVALKLIADGII